MTAIRSWNETVLVGEEPSFGTPLLPASAQAVEAISMDMGPAEQGNTRAKKDKIQGRDETNEFIEGRVEPIAFVLETSAKTRAAADTTPKVSSLLKAGGLVETIGANVAYTLSANPTPPSLSILTAAGQGTGAQYAEHGRGGIITAIGIKGGNGEPTYRFAGAFAGKYHLGKATGSLTDGSDTSLALDAVADAYKLALGWYQIESEVVKVTAIDYSTGILTVTRAQAGSSAAAHASATLYPYVPTPTFAGSPISEVNDTVTIDGVSIQALSWAVDLTTGIRHLPLATGSKYTQGSSVHRVSVRAQAELVLTEAQLALLGKMTQRKNCAVAISCGTGTGGNLDISLPYAEIEPFQTPRPANDLTVVQLGFRVRGSATGSDSFSLTLG